MKNKKKIIIPLAIAAAVVVGVIVAFLIFRGTGNSGKIYVQKVSTLTGQVPSSNRYSGVVETQKTEKIELESGRSVDALYVTEGQSVKAGDRLFTYNTDSLLLDISQLQYEIEKYNANISNYNNQIEVLKKEMESASSEDRIACAAQIQQLQTDIIQAQYDIKTKQNEINTKNNEIKNSTVYASISGTVQSINDSSYSANADGEGSGSNTFITIIATGNVRIKGTIGEQNIMEIYSGEEVIVRSRVNKKETWKGKITAINTQNSEEETGYYGNKGESTTYSFYVNLDNTEGLMLGQHVTIEADNGQGADKDGIYLNSGWLVEEDGNFYLWVAKSAGSGLEKRKVEIGNYDKDLDEYEILSGVKEEEYIAWPDEECTPGAKTTAEFVETEESNE